MIIPRVTGCETMHSIRLIGVHFWLAFSGLLLYVTAMWVAGARQGLMWGASNADGTLVYSFMDALRMTYPWYGVRLLGGILTLAGMLVMLYNVWQTISVRETRAAPATVPGRA